MEPKLTDLTCPEGRGTIWEVQRGNGKEYRCRVGHSYSPRSMLAEHFAAQERTLWAAVVALDEGTVLTNMLDGQLEPALRGQLRAESRQRQEQAAALRKLLQEREAFPLD